MLQHRLTVFFRAHPPAPPQTSTGCREAACLTMVFSTGYRGISALVPGASAPPLLISAPAKFLSYFHPFLQLQLLLCDFTHICQICYHIGATTAADWVTFSQQLVCVGTHRHCLYSSPYRGHCYQKPCCGNPNQCDCLISSIRGGWVGAKTVLLCITITARTQASLILLGIFSSPGLLRNSALNLPLDSGFHEHQIYLISFFILIKRQYLTT